MIHIVDRIKGPLEFELKSIDSDADLLRGMHAFLDKRTSSLAVYDKEKHSFLGWIDVLDVAKLIAIMGENQDLSDLMDKGPEKWRESDKKIVDEQLEAMHKVPVKDMINLSHRDDWLELDEKDTTVHELMKRLSGNNPRRILIKGINGIEGLISGTDLIRYLRNKLAHTDLFVHTPYVEIAEDSKHDVVSIASTAKAIDGFELMAKSHVSALAVVDERGVLIGVLSASDFLASAKTTRWKEWSLLFKDLSLPIIDYLGVQHNRIFPHNHSKHPLTVTNEDTPFSVINKMVSARVHRLFRVDSENKPIQVVSISDVLSTLVNF